MDWVVGILVVTLIASLLGVWAEVLKRRIERVEKKLDGLMSALDVNWVDDAERERISKLAADIYAEGKVEEAEKLMAQLEPVKKGVRQSLAENSLRESSEA